MLDCRVSDSAGSAVSPIFPGFCGKADVVSDSLRTATAAGGVLSPPAGVTGGAPAAWKELVPPKELGLRPVAIRAALAARSGPDAHRCRLAPRCPTARRGGQLWRVRHGLAAVNRFASQYLRFRPSIRDLRRFAPGHPRPRPCGCDRRDGRVVRSTGSSGSQGATQPQLINQMWGVKFPRLVAHTRKACLTDVSGSRSPASVLVAGRSRPASSRDLRRAGPA
ncbi:hypothetical protein CcI6DRAFT_01935 [Frankia sp. CcI6]|jgi:hypothetical protein|nr:hypothetical protein CcI6DRAFT_01935 [Frankia sp. CcI6]KDA42086.1 hypothetical protein BMG523Draft_03098 [Frankia sp. BMG5.23]